MPRVLEKQLLRLRELCDTMDNGERNMRNFFDTSPDLLAVVSVDGSFVQTNHSWQKLLGWDQATMDEVPWLHLIHEGDQSALRDAIGYLVTDDLTGFVCRVRHAEGRYCVVEFSATKWCGGLSNMIGRLVPEACS